MRNRLKSTLKTFNKGQRGMVLPIVLIVLLLIALMIPPLMGLVGTSLVTGKMYENSSYELYAADAGVMDASWFLEGLQLPGKGYIDPQYIAEYFGEDGTYTYTLQEEINDKTVTVEIVMGGNGTYFTITSTATGSNGSSTTIETQVEYPPPPPPIWVAVGALDGHLKISAEVGSPSLPGEPGWIGVYANGDIYMIGGSIVYGDAYYTEGHGIEQYPSSGMFYGTGIECTELQLDLDIIPEPTETTEIWVGDLSITESGEQLLGDIYILGDLKISGEAQVHLTGTVWVTGKISIGSNSVVYGKDSDDKPYFMISEHSGTGDAISVPGGTPDGYEFKVEAALYAPNGPIYVGGNASLDGSAVGESIDIQGTSRLTNPMPFEPVPRDWEPLEFKYWKIT